MRFAAIETSTEWCSVALWSDGEIVAVERRAGNRHSELALPMLEKLLGKNRLDAVAFGAGPGAFTGLRIACGLAQGIAFGRGLPVLGVSTLEAMAQESGAQRVVACLDARMREVYVASYARNANGWSRIGDPAVVKPEQVRVADPGHWHGAGDGFAAYPELATRLALADADPAIVPDAQAVAEWAWPHLVAGEGGPAADAQPLYVRHRVALTSAERAAGLRL